MLSLLLTPLVNLTYWLLLAQGGGHLQDCSSAWADSLAGHGLAHVQRHLHCPGCSSCCWVSHPPPGAIHPKILEVLTKSA